MKRNFKILHINIDKNINMKNAYLFERFKPSGWEYVSNHF